MRTRSQRVLRLASLPTLLAALSLGPPARAQNFTNADLAGDYAFTAVKDDADRLEGQSRGGSGLAIVGMFSADGAGSITSGTRILRHTQWRRVTIGQQLTVTLPRQATVAVDHPQVNVAAPIR